MKKIIFSLIAVLVISVNAFAVEFSIGATVLGWGPTFVRGDGPIASSFDGITKLEQPINLNMAFSPLASIVGQVDFIPYLALEFGVGYAIKNIGIDAIFESVKFTFNQISVPVLLKGQYEIADKANIYIGVGPKFNFNLMPKATITLLGLQTIGDLKKEAYNMFDMDLTFALGAEFKVATRHYLGFRVAYDMNLLGSLNYNNTILDKWEKDKTYVDDLAISFTYRYKFVN